MVPTKSGATIPRRRILLGPRNLPASGASVGERHRTPLRAPHAREIPTRTLAWLLVATACTATVDDSDPFTTVGMSGATTSASGSSETSSDTTEAGATSDTGGTTPADGSSSDGSAPTEGTAEDTAAGDCEPPCDPQTSVCEAGQCVAPGPPLAGALVITELMPNPAATTDDDGEWIELVNVGTAPVDLEGCVLYDDANDEDVVNTGAPLVVPPGGVVVFAKVADIGQNGGVPGVAYAFGGSFSLTNTGDAVRLECDGAVIDEVVYLETWPFAAGAAMQLDAAADDAAANDALASWCAATAVYGAGDLGTPGQANPAC